MAAPQRSDQLCVRERLNLMDIQGADLLLALVLLLLVCVVCKWPWPECKTVVCWMSGHASLSVVHGFSSCCYEDFYCRHRTAINVAFHSLQLATLSNTGGIGAFMALASGTQLAAGKAAQFTLVLLCCGSGAYAVAAHSIMARLPRKIAAISTVAWAVVTSWANLPQQLRYLCNSDVRDFALVVKSSVDSVYSTATGMSLTALTTVDAAAAPSCSLLSLALWVHLLIGGLIPLYILCISSPVHSTGTRAVVDSRRSSDNAPDYWSQVAARQDVEPSFLQLASVIAYHCVTMFGLSMLLWTLIDCLVVLFEGPAEHFGVCV